MQSAIEFGEQLIATCKEKGEAVPEWVWERMIELYKAEIEELKKGART